VTSATVRSSSGTGHRVEGHGLLIFASVLLMVLGLFNLLWSLTIIAVDMVALYALCVYGSRSNVTA
jgi:hypothetical protein